MGLVKISEQLRQLRQQRQWNQDTVAERLHVSRQTISNWENDRSLPDLQSLLLLADLYHITLDDLVRGELNMVEFKRTKRRLLGDTLGTVLALSVFLLASVLQESNRWWLILGILALIVQGYFGFRSIQLSRRKNIYTMAEILNYLKTGQIRPSNHRRARIILETVGALLIGGLTGGIFAWFWL
ncbi:MAG: helix-turn-helix domain-containing protein [Lactobacillus sp.]|nr:MAG: helix-turn-helix domain-containing protein [Lactobacillus sp.]